MIKILLISIALGIIFNIILVGIEEYYYFKIVYRIHQVIMYLIAISFLMIPFFYPDEIVKFICIGSGCFWLIRSFAYKFICDEFDIEESGEPEESEESDKQDK